MNFPLIRVDGFKGWIPNTDVDGVDISSDILSDAENIMYRNGFIETGFEVAARDLPAVVANDINNNDYALLSAHSFTHSTQGLQTVYVLWNSASSLLRIYLGSTLMDIDEQNSDVTFNGIPTGINYNLANDQLKINLNCTGTYNALAGGVGKTIILNLTLVYINEIMIYRSVLGSDYLRDAGWYLFPRWLGTSYATDVIADSPIADSVFHLDNDFTNTGTAVISTTNYNTGFYSGAGVYEGTYSLLLGTSIGDAAGFSIQADYPTSIDFWAVSDVLNSNTVRLTVTELDADLNILHTTEFSVPKTWAHYQVAIFNINTVYVEIGKPASSVSEVFYIDLVTVGYGVTEYVVLAKYRDGQRALLQNGDGGNVLDPAGVITVQKSEIDWRVNAYEIYLEADGVYYLAQSIPVAGGAYSWTENTNDLTQALNLILTDTTLNFNYNLPFDSRVDNERNIISEAVHKGRIYFVNNTEKVYQSHISQLALQADSFPYDEDTGFGYFIVKYGKLNKAIAVTGTNDLAIFTDAGFYVYFIQAGAGGVYQTLKLSSGSIGFVSIKSLAKADSGEPATDGLMWIDYNGIYLHYGGVDAPINIIQPTHEKYWLGISDADKDDACCFYNSVLREFWIALGGTVIIYEPAYKIFKTYDVDLPTEYVGIENNEVVYIYGAENSLRKLSMATKAKLSVVSHEMSAFLEERLAAKPAPEIYHKILQEVYVVFGTSDTDTVTMTVYCDGVSIGTFTFDSSLKIDKWLVPYGIRFNNIKFALVNATANKTIRIKEFGCTYSTDYKQPLGVLS